jgi:hypothetical protein
VPAAILDAVSLAPFIDGLRGNSEAFCKRRPNIIAGLNGGAHLRRRRGLLVKMDQHGRTPSRLAGKPSPGLFSDPPHSLKTDLAMKSVERRGEM